MASKVRSLTCLGVFLFIVSLSDEKFIKPDTAKVYHDVIAGLGLYNNFKQIFELTTSNFKETVFPNECSKTWIVEFYNSWCGHCHKFVPIYKTFAADVYNWRDVVMVGAVDCSNDTNNQLCRDYEIMFYPSIKTFPMCSREKFLGKPFEKGSANEMVSAVVKILETEDTEGKVRKNLNFKPVMTSTVDSVWNGVAETVEFVFLVVHDPVDQPHLGSEVALDLYQMKNLLVRTVFPSNSALLEKLPSVILPSIFVVHRSYHVEVIPILHRDNYRDSIYHVIGQFLATRGIQLPVREKVNVTDDDIDTSGMFHQYQLKEWLRKKFHSKDLSDVVFEVDIENALRYSLYQEIGSHKVIDGDKLDALKAYLVVLSKYFPFTVDGKNFLESIKNDVLPRDVVYGQNFSTLASNTESFYSSIFLPKQDWMGCKGTFPQFRGYPCGLWTMFHTLTIQAYNKQNEFPGSNSQEVLRAMVGYIKHFFGCSECSIHFQRMASTMPGNVSSIDQSILWLWKAHNTVNKRLANDVTEDPVHKKVQFPSEHACPKCRNSDHEWIEQNVLEFLKSMYSNISYIQWSDFQPSGTTSKPTEISYSKRLRNNNYGRDNSYETHDNDGTASKSSGDFNVFDISLCVLLYVSSVIILLLVCIKFVMKKSHKKKNSFDLYHNKV